MLIQMVMETLTVYSPLLNCGDASRQLSDCMKSAGFCIKLVNARTRRNLKRQVVRKNLIKRLPMKRLDLCGNYYVQ